MTHHLSKLQVTQFCVSALPEDELAAAAVHTDECESCHRLFVEEVKRRRGRISFNFTLEPEFWFQHEHLDSNQLVAVAEKSLDHETEEIINIHLKTCGTCREDVRSFLTFRDATAREMDVSYGPTYDEFTCDVPRAPWWQRLDRKPVYAVAAIVLLAVALLIGVVALSRRSVPLEAKRQDQRNPSVDRPSLSQSPAPNVVSGPTNVDDSAKVAVLKDAGGEVTIDTTGRVTGLDPLSDNTRQYVAQALVSGQIEPAEVLRRLSGEQSGLRGINDDLQKFRQLYPTRRVVVEERPVFRWESLPGASSYRIYVLDADGNQVSQSEELAPTATQWKTTTPLRRGQIFSWTVTALLEGKKVASPSASDPEVKFGVLSSTDLQELSHLKKLNSHLALGVFYARAGLLNEAERAFQSLVQLNPESELPRKLLQSVRSMRKPDQ